MDDNYSYTDEVTLEETNDDEPVERRSRRRTSIDSRAPWLCVALNVFCTFLFGYAIYFQNYNPQAILYNRVLPPALQPYGLWKFLTYNSVVIQFFSCSLHLLARFIPKYTYLRDFLFTTLAYPVGSFVVSTFWIVWWTQGREVIFPTILEPYYPVWLNHVSHTIIVPVNIAQAYLTFHRYSKKGSIVTFCYATGYCCFMFFIRYKAGTFVYPFLNAMSTVAITIYVASIIFCTVALYETGYFLTGVFYVKKTRRDVSE